MHPLNCHAASGILVGLASMILVSCAGGLGGPPDTPAQDPLTLALPVPEGDCSLAEANPVDAEFLKWTRYIHKGWGGVRTMFADCGELTALRESGARPVHYGSYIFAYQYVTMPSSFVGHFEDLPRARAVTFIAEELRDTDPTAPSLASTPYVLATGARGELGQQRLKYLGVLETTESAVYIGTLESLVFEGITLATITGLTSVGGWLLSINLSAPYEGEETIELLKDQQRDNIQRLIAANS